MSLWKLNKSIFDKTMTVASKVPIMGSTLSLRRNQTEVQTNPIPPKNSTIDTADVNFFSQKMESWWNVTGEMRLLHSMNLLRVPFVRDGLVNSTKKDLHPLRDKKILDVGCGGGILSEGLARLGATVTGIDASKDLIEIAEQHKHVDPKIAGNKPQYIHSTIEDHAKTAANLYDAVVASEVIEHVHNQELFVKSCVRTLKPGGRIFITTPNRTRWSQFAVIYLAENVLQAVPKGAHQYEKFITPNELTFLLERMLEENLRYVAVKPSASISVLRQKVWHLLELPDFCEEIILLKRNNEVIPLTELRKGNDPQNPFILEVWLPNNGNRLTSSTTIHNNMLTIGNGEEESNFANRKQNESMVYEKEHDDKFCPGPIFSQSTLSNDTTAFNKLRFSANKPTTNTLLSDFKKSDISCRISSTSIFRLNKKKSRDNFANILLKIQSDLSTLSNKLSVLETKLPA